MIRRALLSVSDKTGLIDFATFLVSQQVELVSTGGTAELLRAHHLPVRDVAELTGFPEMMAGRVKTLHPRVHGGLLARRADAAHMQSAADHGIEMIDLLVVNLYPFEETLNKVGGRVASHGEPRSEGVSGEAAKGGETPPSYDILVENIDIGGPAMIRAAAKNHESVAVIVDVADYAAIETMMRENNNEITAAARRRFAAKAFARCASYDTLISSWLSGTVASDLAEQLPTSFPPYLLDAALGQTLRYGENPHQAAALYQRLDGKGGIAHATQLQGKELSYNNLADADAAWQIACSMGCVAEGEPRSEGVSANGVQGPRREGDKSNDSPPAAAVLIKHANPCGVATDASLVTAFTKALASDPVSAFGGILAVNRTVDAALVDAIGGLFLEVIVAPDFSDEARAKLAAKKNLRLLMAQPENHQSPLSGWMIQAISGGYLVQENDSFLKRALSPTLPLTAAVSGLPWKATHDCFTANGWQLVTGDSPAAARMADAALAWNVVKFVKSNAIVLVKNGATIGVGAGQMSRVDSVRIAIEKARAHGHDPKGAVLASDAFFPFADNVELAAQAGISLVIQPGGSVRDPEVIEAANKHGIAMLFTGSRHFKH